MNRNEITEINQYYLSILSQHGISAEIQPVHGNAPAQEILAENGTRIIRLNLDKIGSYEDFLSYNVRKLVLPCLRLETERLVIRRFQERDGEGIFEFCQNRECCYMDGGYEPDTEMDEAYWAQIREFSQDDSRYAIVRKDTGAAIGGIHLMPCDNRAVECAEVGYYINPSQHRKGYAFEALSAFLGYLLDDLHLDMVVAGVIEANIPSQKLLKKLGFTYEGNIHKAFCHPVLGKIDLLSFYRDR